MAKRLALTDRGVLWVTVPGDLFDGGGWGPYSEPFPESGTLERGGYLTASSSGWLSEGDGFSGYLPVTLADVLEPATAPKYLLSPTACAGILRRADRRGRELPPRLRRALEGRAEIAAANS